MYNFRATLIVFALINLIVASVISHKIINQYIIYILICTYAFFAEVIGVLSLQKFQRHLRYRKYSKALKGVDVTAKIFSILGFFILVTNVFVFKNNQRPCDHCIIISVYWIIIGGLYILFYFVYLLHTFGYSYYRTVK